MLTLSASRTSWNWLHLEEACTAVTPYRVTLRNAPNEIARVKIDLTMQSRNAYIRLYMAASVQLEIAASVRWVICIITAGESRYSCFFSKCAYLQDDSNLNNAFAVETA